MKTKFILSAIFLGLFSFQTRSQEQVADGKPAKIKPEKQPSEMRTIFGNCHGKIDNGVYAGLSLGYSTIDGKDAMVFGGRAGWVIDHHFTLGISANCFFNNLNGEYHLQPTEKNYRLGGGYLGVFLEPIIAPNNPVHVSFPIIFGLGGAAVMDRNKNYDKDPNYNNTTSSPFFVCEPGVDVEFNLLKFFRLALNASYRHTSDIHLNYYSPNGLTHFNIPADALRGMSYGVTLKFGWF